MIYISMLRGINVGGHKTIKMNELKRLYESMGFKKVQTYIQSGNVIFGSASKSATSLSKKIEIEIERTFGFTVIVILRKINEIKQIIDKNPFIMRKLDHAKLNVTFLSDKRARISPVEFEKVTSMSEEIEFFDKELYLYFPNGSGRSRLSNKFIENKLKVSATSRNWRTVNKLFEIASDLSN